LICAIGGIPGAILIMLLHVFGIGVLTSVPPGRTKISFSKPGFSVGLTESFIIEESVF